MGRWPQPAEKGTPYTARLFKSDWEKLMSSCNRWLGVKAASQEHRCPGTRGRGDWPPGICAAASPALCWADRACGFYEETLIKRLSPNPCPIVLHSPPHSILSLAAPSHLSAKGPVDPREFHVHPPHLPSLSFHVSSRSPSPAGARDHPALRRAWEGRAPHLSRKCAWWPQPPSRRPPPVQAGPPACACLS